MLSRQPTIPVRPALWRWMFAAGAALTLAAGAAAAVLRVSFDAVLDPLAFLDPEGKPAGYAADYVRALARQAGWEVELVGGTREQVQADFWAGRNAIIALLVYTEERAKLMDFTTPYVTLKGAVFTRRGTAPVNSPADLAGRKVAVSRGNVTHDYLKTHPEWGVELVLVDSTEAGLRAVQDGTCDASINVDLVAQKIIRDRRFDRVVRAEAELPGLAYSYCMAVHKGDTALLRRINEAQLAFQASDEFREIHERWIGPLHTSGLTWRQVRPLVAPAALLLVAIALAFVWQRRNLRLLAAQAEALRSSEQRLNLVLEGGGHCLWDWDLPRGRIMRGPLLAEMLGYRAEEIAPTPEGVTALIHPGQRSEVTDLLTMVERPGRESFSAEFRMRTKSGDWRWIATSGRVMQRDAAGRALRAVGTHTDITRRKEAEEAVRRLNRELEHRVAERTAELAARVTEVEQLNHELEAFSYSVSHDLRSPLRNITGFLELLARRISGRLDAEGERFITTVTTEAARLSRLIDELLAFSRLGRSAMTVQPVALAELVAEVREELRAEIGDRRIDWRIGALPAIQGDRTLVRQVLANLLGNAVKFSRQRDPAVIEVGELTPSDAAGLATIFVRDNGDGFDPRYAGKLFGVFQRLHRAKDFAGTGIGLANVKRIVTRHGGRVHAEGQIGQGATFYFLLPRAAPPAAAA